MEPTLNAPSKSAPLHPKEKVTCPACGSKACDRISRNFLVKLLLPWSKIRRFRCYKCFKVFYKS